MERYTISLVTDMADNNIFRIKSEDYIKVDGSVEAHSAGRKLSRQQRKPVMVSDQTFAEADIYIDGKHVKRYRCPNT